jgi:hypothetical protein
MNSKQGIKRNMSKDDLVHEGEKRPFSSVSNDSKHIYAKAKEKARKHLQVR